MKKRHLLGDTRDDVAEEHRGRARVVTQLRPLTMGRLPGWSRRLAEIGALPSDSDELRVRKAVLVLSSALMAGLSVVWVVTYASLGLWLSALIPLAYQLASAVSIYTFARTRRYLLFRWSQLCMSLVLPFALQWSLGGFEASSAAKIGAPVRTARASASEGRESIGISRPFSWSVTSA